MRPLVETWIARGGGAFDGQGRPGDYALKVERAKIGGSVWLSKGFLTKGPVTLFGMSIGGNLDCGDGKFTQDTNYTSYFNAEFVKIEGSVKLDDISVIGRVDFCNSKIANEFSWQGVMTPSASLDLSFAQVGTLIDKTNSWPAPGALFLQGFVYNRIQLPSPANATTRIGWLHRQPGGVFMAQPYKQLAAVFRSLGMEDDAVEVLVAKNHDYAKTLQWA